MNWWGVSVGKGAYCQSSEPIGPGPHIEEREPTPTGCLLTSTHPLLNSCPICTCACAHTRTYTHVYLHTYIVHTYMHTCTYTPHVYIRMHINIHTYTHTHRHIHFHIHTHSCCIHTYANTHTLIYTHIPMHTHMHSHTHSVSSCHSYHSLEGANVWCWWPSPMPDHVLFIRGSSTFAILPVSLAWSSWDVALVPSPQLQEPQLLGEAASSPDHCSPVPAEASPLVSHDLSQSSMMVAVFLL